MEDNRQKDLRRKQLGRRGEDVAAAMLQQKGMAVIARNVHCGGSEIDLIALQDMSEKGKREIFVRFVEVKSRHCPTEGDPVEAVNLRKQRRIVSAAKAWLCSEQCHDSLKNAGCAEASEVHFDVITLVWNEDWSDCLAEYIPDAFYPIYT